MNDTQNQHDFDCAKQGVKRGSSELKSSHSARVDLQFLQTQTQPPGFAVPL